MNPNLEQFGGRLVPFFGDYITVARRSGRDWFVGSMTDEQPETLSVPLRFPTERRTDPDTTIGA